MKLNFFVRDSKSGMILLFSDAIIKLCWIFSYQLITDENFSEEIQISLISFDHLLILNLMMGLGLMIDCLELVEVALDLFRIDLEFLLDFDFRECESSS